MLGKYKNVQDLFVIGKVVPLPDGRVLWVQAMNPFESEDARSAAQAARARVMLAMREHGADEQVQLRASFTSAQEPALEIAEFETNRKIPQFVEEIRFDPEWSERLEFIERDEDLVAAKATEAEQEMLAKINADYIAELSKRIDDEREFVVRSLEGLDEDALFERFRDGWLERLGSDRMIAEYELTETYLCARACEASPLENADEWDHSACDHRGRVFESKDEVRGAPEGLIQLIRAAINDINIGGVRGKASGTPTSSSGPSTTPSSPEESTPSTPVETSSAAPGTSTPPSPTP